jgi:hypothetical protein
MKGFVNMALLSFAKGLIGCSSALEHWQTTPSWKNYLLLHKLAMHTSGSSQVRLERWTP